MLELTRDITPKEFDWLELPKDYSVSITQPSSLFI